MSKPSPGIGVSRSETQVEAEEVAAPNPDSMRALFEVLEWEDSGRRLLEAQFSASSKRFQHKRQRQ